MVRTCVLATLLALASADLPIDCRYKDVIGTWDFSETARTQDHNALCGPKFKLDIVYNKTFEFIYPNVVTDEIGNVGTWTLVYNQGFEVNINERSYWAFFYNTPADQSFKCDRLSVGWSRDTTLRHWACFTGFKRTQDNTTRKTSSPPHLHLDAKFVNNRELIKKINEAQSSWTAKAYPDHERYTNREWVRRSGGHRIPLPGRGAPTAAQLTAAARLPTNFDWRDFGGLDYVSPVRDQADCGSCYSFASTAMVEARLRIATNFSRQDILSPQNVLDCSLLSQGCNGGFAYLIAGRYAHEQGFVDEKCTPYQAEDGTCYTPSNCTRTFVNEYNYVGGYYGGATEEAMMLELVANGPVAVGFEVLPDFRHYSGGIYHHVTSLEGSFDPYVVTNHAVLVVGYGVDAASGEKFWAVKNSWGADWGLSGYFKIRRGTDEVGIESMPFASTVIP